MKIRCISPEARFGMAREEAAEYIGVSPNLFDQLVDDGRMPKARKINSRRLWMRIEVEKAFALLPVEGQDVEDMAGDPWSVTRVS